MSSINLSADFSEAIQQTLQYINLSKQAEDGLRKWQVAIAKFNKDGEVAQATIRAQISDTQQLVSSIKLVDGVYQFAGARVTEVTKKLADLSKANRDAAQTAKLAAQEEQKLADAMIRSNQAAARANRSDFLKQVTASSAQAINSFGQVERSRLQSLAGSLPQGLSGLAGKIDISSEAQGRLGVIANQIAKLGTAAGLSTQQLVKLFREVSAGNLNGIDQKYASVVSNIQKYNKVIEEERGRIAKSLTTASGGGPSLPKPDQSNIDHLKNYFSVLQRIQATLTNLALYRGFNLLTNSITDAVGSTRELQINISLIRTLSQDAQLSADAWAESIRKVSGETGFAQNDIAALYYDIISNQVAAGGAVEDVARKAAELARVVKSTPKEAGNLLASVANTYGAEAGSLDEISAKLFKTIDLGRVSAGELQNSFGRVENTGKQLGVTFDELLASMSSLTITGLKTDESMTLLFNVMKALQSPTGAMKDAISQLGYASGPTAVKTETLFGVLKKLVDLSKQGKVDLASIFPDAREQRFIAAFTNDTKTFESNLNRIKNQSGQAFAAAKDIRGESEADKLTKNIERLKNTLSATAGEGLTKLISQFVDLTGQAKNLEATASRLFQRFAAGGITVGTFIVTMRSLAVVADLVAARNARLAASSVAATAAQVRQTQATAAGIAVQSRAAGIGGFAGANPGLAAAGLAVTALVGYQAFSNIVKDDFSSLTQSYNELVSRVKEESLTKELDKSVDKARQLKEQFQDAGKVISTTLAKGFQDNESALSNIRDRLRETNNSLKAGFVGVLDISNNKLGTLEQRLNAIKSAAQNISNQQTRQGFRDRAQDSLFGTANKFATPTQQLQLIEAEYQATERKIQGLIRQGTPEALQEVQKLYDKELELTSRFYEHDADLRYKAFQQELEQKQARGEAIGPGENVFTYDPTNQQKSLNELVARKEATEARILAILKEQQRVKETEIAKEKTRIDEQKKAIDEFENFSIIDQNSGTVKKKYQDSSGRLDEKKALADFDAQARNLRDKVDPDVVNRLGFNDQLNQRRRLQQQEIERLKIRGQLSTEQTKAVDLDKKANDLVDKSTESLKKYNEQAAGAAKIGKAQLDAIIGITTEAPGAIRDQAAEDPTVSRFERYKRRNRNLAQGAEERLGIETPQTRAEDTARQIVAAANDLKKRYDDLQKNPIDVNGQKVIDPNALRQLQADQLQLEKQVKEFLKSEINRQGLGGVQPEGYAVPGGSGKTLKDVIDETRQSQAELEKLGPTLSKGLDLSQQVQQLQELSSKADNVAKSYQANSTGLAALVGGLSSVTNAEIANLNLLIEKAREANGVLGGGAPNPEAPERRAYGGPIGSDSRMAYVKGGEYVLNDGATSRFYSRINAMNNMGRVPERFNTGGPVTNMNGYTFNINEAGDAGMTGREVHRILKRMKRTGGL